jgi:hypothetical protein
MKSNRLALAGALVAGALALSPAAPAWANPILVGPPSAATGIDGLVINLGPGPITYDVTFINTGFTFGDITFNNVNGATAAATALQQALNSLGVTGLVNGVSINDYAAVPFTFGNPMLSEATQLLGTGWQNPVAVSSPNVGGSASLANGDFAVFTVEVPGPIVGAGIPGLIGACVSLLVLGRRRKQIAV